MDRAEAKRGKRELKESGRGRARREKEEKEEEERRKIEEKNQRNWIPKVTHRKDGYQDPHSFAQNPDDISA